MSFYSLRGSVHVMNLRVTVVWRLVSVAVSSLMIIAKLQITIFMPLVNVRFGKIKFMVWLHRAMTWRVLQQNTF